jgi:hypothetical protein
LWLTALSFLAHSASGVPEASSFPPPIPQREPEIPQQRSGATLRKAHIRDSVRLAKDKTNPPIRQFSAPAGDAIPQHSDNWDKPIPDAADPPSIPRYHGRKRSLTGPRQHSQGMHHGIPRDAIPSMYSTGSSDLYGPGPSIAPSVPSTIYNPGSVVTSGRNSEASTSTRHNFFDAMGTVRMEAFVERVDARTSDDVPPSNFSYKSRQPGRRRGNTQWSSSTNDASRSGGLYDDFVYDGSDPFRNF